MSNSYLYTSNSSKKLESLLVLATGLVLVNTHAIAEVEPTEIPTRPSDRQLVVPKPPSEDGALDFKLPNVPNKIPGTHDQSLMRLKVDSVVFDGNKQISTEALLQIAKPFIGKQLLAAEIEDLRYQITQHYISKGYVNSGALINANSYQNGTLTFRIIEGKLEDIRITGTQRLQPGYVKNRLSKEGEVLNINTLQERFRLLLADPLFSKVTARVLPGTSLGDAVLG